MARLTIKPTKPTIKRKQGRPANNAKKQARNWVLDTCDIWKILLLTIQQNKQWIEFLNACDI